VKRLENVEGLAKSENGAKSLQGNFSASLNSRSPRSAELRRHLRCTLINEFLSR